MLRNKANRSVMKHDFGLTPNINIARSTFNRSHGIKTAFDCDGTIYPIFWDEALPGDTINLRLNFIARLHAINTVCMDNLYLDVHFFSCPNRLLWDNWKKFMGEQVDPGDSVDYTVPVNTTPGGGYAEESLYDYFGIPPGIDNCDPTAFNFRCYQFVWNEWYRDQNLQDSVTVDTGDGPDTDTDYTLRKRGKRKDYFTSCLPWPQKATSAQEINLPLGTTAPITGLATTNGYTFTSGSQAVDETGGVDTTYTKYMDVRNAGTDKLWVEEDADNAGYPGIYANLSDATSATINELREALLLQKLLEIDARGGTRYEEIVKNHFQCQMPALRYRPEFLGGGTARVNITPIPNTSSTVNDLGELGAIGYVEGNNISFTKSFDEHCTVIGVVSARADLTYSQGMDRSYFRSTRYDYFFPVLSHLGEQTVYNGEIFMVNGATDTDGDGTPDNKEAFGYNERWSEYRFKNSVITGKLRVDSASNLDYWHLSQDFASTPTLTANGGFIVENPPVSRIVTSTAEPNLTFDGYFSQIHTRPMPTFSIPGFGTSL